MLTKMKILGRLELFKTNRQQPDGEVTLDGVVDQLVIAGTPDEVAEQIVAFRDEVGDFGELVYAGLDWVDERLARRSMELMAEAVIPAVNASTAPAAAS
jgi:alkanesulfonate monooxygenase SsuD/methylene tetrahydromethanopterin reductase-like flavin-dependent oxidoreductase (luciferase family)